MEIELYQVSSIQFGVYEKPVEAGSIMYLQARHFTDTGEFLIGQVDSFLTRSFSTERHLLTAGDVLLAGKGNRIFAWCYHPDIGPAVASTIFFVLRPKTDRLLPDFLAIYLNLPICQAFFQQLGAGSSILSIRKNELAELPVSIPSLEIQQQIVTLKQLHQQETGLLQNLLQHKKALYEASISTLLKR